MPSRQQHLDKADGNAVFALSLPLNSQANIDWALIALFYGAMHYIEAFLAPTVHLRSHESRDKYISREASLRKIFTQYQHLKYFGFNARYEVQAFKARDVTDEASVDFEAIKTHILSKI